MDGLRLFIAVDNYAAVKIGDPQKETRSKKVVTPRFTTDFPGAVLLDAAGELTLRAHEEGVFRTFIDTANVGNKRWRPPQVDEDWHAFCSAIFEGIERPEWEAMCYRYKDLHQAVKKQEMEEHEKAKVLWALKEAKDRGVDFYDASHEKNIKTRAK